MSSVFDVSPYDGGWCVKIVDTGEVMFFRARRKAIAAAHDLARRWSANAKVQVRRRLDLRAPGAPTSSFSYPLGAPA